MSAAYRQTWAPPHNDTVESQRPGFCVWDEPRAVFLKAYRFQPSGRLVSEWSAVPSDALVFVALGEARTVATQTKAGLSTVPRFNGHVRTWEVLA